MHNFSLLIQKSSIKLSPKRYFLNNLRNSFFLLFGVSSFYKIILAVFNSLLIFQKI